MKHKSIALSIRFLKQGVFLLSGFLTLNQWAFSQEEEYVYPVKHMTGAITIDGELSESSWEKAPVVGDFRMNYPVDDRKVDPGIRTEVRVMANDQFIYIGAVCYGPSGYVIKTLKRDAEFWDGDGFGVVIDPVNEKTNGYVFGISPAGVQTEYLVTGQTGRREDPEPGQQPTGLNLAWDNKWYSEVSNFPDRWVVEIAIPFKTIRYDAGKIRWGINFFRRDASGNSIHSWAPVPIEFNETDLGYTGILQWDRAPEKVAGNVALIPYIRGGLLKDFESGGVFDPDFQPGLDAKVPVTSSLNLDLTINPDFSQVEVDEQVINLTLFDIRLPEKRLFFLENNDIFEDFGIPPMRPFFSRRIGLDQSGNPIPILYGARLSGNVNQDLRIGVMNLQTRPTEDFLAQNYTVAAVHRQVLARSVIKGYIQNRQVLGSEDDDYNRNAGLELQYRSEDGRFQTFGGIAKSFNPGLSSGNYFYHLATGYDNRNISLYTNLAGLGKNYLQDLSFLRGQEYYDASRDTLIRIGFNHWFARGSYTLYPEKSKRVISHEFSGRFVYDADSAFRRINADLEMGYTLKLASTALVQVTVNNTRVDLIFPFTFIGGEPLPAGYYSFNQAQVRLMTDQRKLFSVGGGVMGGTFYNGNRIQVLASLKYRAQPWGNFAVNFEQNNLQFPDPYGSERIFLISPRIEINFSRSLFWTTFLQYNTQSDNFNINSRLQWRFQPMSDLYIVYTDNYAVEFWGPKNRALVLKLNYWFNF